jgi:trans-aconitate methyltransferase
MPSPQPQGTDEIFDAAARDYDAAAKVLWDPLGAAYVELAAPGPGERVLDACCGAGASAIPAGRAVGGSGTVDAVDQARGPIELGRRRATAGRLDQVRFHVADVTGWTAPQPYDLLLCGYGVFFLPEMDASARHLAGRLRPEGRFTVATWAKGAMEDFGGLLFRTVGTERPMESSEPPSRKASLRINTEITLGEWAQSLGLSDVTTHRIDLRVPLTYGNAWDLVLGTGFRGMLHGLDDQAVRRVHDRFLDALGAEGPGELDASTLVVIGTAV